MIHYGDVCKINGAKIPKVDIITFGAPCQDLSCAGKRAGMKSVLMGDEETTRSGLFFEAIRIIKEMREDDRKNGRSEIRPRYAVYENVPGAFSSNKGEDFRAVLEETAKVADENAVIPRPPKGKWTHAGCIVGDGWSLAWRVHDAQFWGIPQRRKRICLLADFEGETAGKILFKLWRETKHRNAEQTVTDFGTEPRSEVQPVGESVLGNTTESRKEREGAAADVRSGIEETGRAISFQERAGKPGGGKGILIQNERTGALSTLNNQSVVYGISSDSSNAMRSSNPNSGIYEAETTRTLDNNGGNPACNQGGMAVVQGADVYNGELTGEKAATLTAASGASPTHSGPSVVCIEGNGQRESHKGDGYKESDTMYTLNTVEQHAVCIENHPADSRVKIAEGINGEISGTLDASYYKGCGERQGVEREVVAQTYQYTTGTLSPGAHAGSYNGQDAYNDMLIVDAHAVDCRNGIENENVNGTLQAKEQGQNLNSNNVVRINSVVRRLTPLECTRLQGFPDGWVDIGDWVDSKGKKHKGEADSPRYKALGNSLALPFWCGLAKRIVAVMKKDNPTMGSLFDGIGGFPLSFSRAGVEPVWASEVEEFAIAVTKRRFPNGELETGSDIGL